MTNSVGFTKINTKINSLNLFFQVVHGRVNVCRRMMSGMIKKEHVPFTSVSERTWDPAMSKCTLCLIQVQQPATKVSKVHVQ